VFDLIKSHLGDGMRRTAFLLTVTFLIVASGIASAQQTDIAASAIGTWTKNVTGKGLEETATKSGGALISFRHFAHQHNGIEANYSYTKNSQVITSVSGAPITRVQSSIHEFTGAYVFHLTEGSVQPFALAGGGFLAFSPTDSAIKAADPSISRQTKPAFLYAAGLDVTVAKKVAVRAQGRGFIYQAPDFYGNQYALHTGATMQMWEASIGLVRRF
jgi:opacity protein-like surface antigen